MSRFELLVPPPIVMFVTGLLMWLLSVLFPALLLVWLHKPVFGIITGVFGVVVSLMGVLVFKRLRTPTDPRHPTASSKLATSGVYRYSRNPMYLGVLLMLVGWTFMLGNLLSALGPLAFIVYITRLQILPEERWLEKKFGSDFQAYKDKVRRWI